MGENAGKKPFDYWQFFADDAHRMGSQLYGRLAEGVGGDAQLRALCANAKPGQPHANLLFGAVHFLLLRGAQAPLRDFYPDLGGADTADAFPAFREFCLSHRLSLIHI